MANTVHEINVNINGLTTVSPTEPRMGDSPAGKVSKNTRIQNTTTGALSGGERTESDFLFNERMRRQARAERVRGQRRGRLLIKEAVFSPGATNRLELAGQGAALYLKNINATALVGMGGTALAAYRVVSDYQKEGASMRGASRKAERIGQQQRTITQAATIVGAIAVNPVLGAITIGFMAYNLAMENRKFIHEQKIDEFKKAYQASRLVNDVSEVRF